MMSINPNFTTDEELKEHNSPQRICNVFINHIDEIQTNAIVKILSNSKNVPTSSIVFNCIGSIRHSEKVDMSVIYNFVSDIVQDTSKTQHEKILNCDAIIYDISNLDSKLLAEIQLIFKCLESWAINTKNNVADGDERNPTKLFILISTPLTWARCPILNKGEKSVDNVSSNENILEEVDYRKRRAHSNYETHKALERQTIWLQRKCKSFVKSIVVCPGFTYGEENAIFHYIFKLGFYNTDPIPILKPGNQILPLLYVKDLAKIIEYILTDFPDTDCRYVFAVQKVRISLFEFAKGILNALNGHCFKLQFVEAEQWIDMCEDLYSQKVLDALSFPHVMVSGYLNTFPFAFDENTDNMWNILISEFRSTRNLSPVKIIVDGPPCSGKTTLALKLAEHYKINYLNGSNILATAIRFYENLIKEAKCSIVYILSEGTNDGNKIKMDVARWEMIANELQVCAKSMNRLKHMEVHQLKRYIRPIISSKNFNDNQGYVIDDFPYNYNAANEIFFNSLDIDLEYDVNSKIIPTAIVLLEVPDSILYNRAMKMDELEAKNSNNTEDELLNRLQNYRERNEEENCLANLFYENNINPIFICVSSDTKPDEIFEKCKAELGPPFLYPQSRLESQKMQKLQADLEKERNKMEKEKRQMLAAQLREKRETNLQLWTQQYERIKNEENILHKAKTLPLRDYLTKCVLPTLTEGILKVAEIKPEDPVDFLAEYLFESNPNGHVLSNSYSEKNQNKLSELCDKQITEMLHSMTENEKTFDCATNINQQI